MRIGGLIKFSLMDYPGRMAAVIFTQGCNFRCSYCHNPELVLPECFGDPIPENDVFDFLRKRRGQLEGVVVTGGEPTVHGDLIPFLQKIKSLKYLIKLDTNGSRPQVLEEILRLKLIDYIAMDLKAPLEDYNRVIGVPMHAPFLKESMNMIIASGIEHQFRTTVVKALISPQDLEQIAAMLPEPRKYKLQQFMSHDKVLDPALLEEEQYNESDLEEIRKEISAGLY